MFNLSGNGRLRGHGFRILNVLRVCNIIALASVMVASMVMVVMTAITNQFFFFDAMTHILLFLLGAFLVLTELQFWWLKRYIPRVWPVFGPDHSFTWLGLAMLSLGCNMLGNLNKPAFTIGNIGLPLWRLILAAGILSITFGFVNLICSIIFRDGEHGITARMIRSDGNLAAAKVDAIDDYYSAHSASLRQKEVDHTETRFKRMTQAFKKTPFSGGGKKLNISAPIPHHHHQDDDLESGSPDHWEDRASPVLPDVQRPPTALHPAYTGGNKSSHYSVASHVDRF